MCCRTCHPHPGPVARDSAYNSTPGLQDTRERVGPVTRFVHTPGVLSASVVSSSSLGLAVGLSGLSVVGASLERSSGPGVYGAPLLFSYVPRRYGRNPGRPEGVDRDHPGAGGLWIHDGGTGVSGEGWFGRQEPQGAEGRRCGPSDGFNRTGASVRLKDLKVSCLPESDYDNELTQTLQAE